MRLSCIKKTLELMWNSMVRIRISRRLISPHTLNKNPRSSGVRRPIAESSVDSYMQKAWFNKTIWENCREREAYRCIYHCALLLLQLDDPTLDAIFDHQFDGLHRTVLAQTMNSIHGLELDSWVPNPFISPHEQLTEAEKNGEPGMGNRYRMS